MCEAAKKLEFAASTGVIIMLCPHCDGRGGPLALQKRWRRSLRQHWLRSHPRGFALHGFQFSSPFSLDAAVCKKIVSRSHHPEKTSHSRIMRRVCDFNDIAEPRISNPRGMQKVSEVNLYLANVPKLRL